MNASMLEYVEGLGTGSRPLQRKAQCIARPLVFDPQESEMYQNCGTMVEMTLSRYAPRLYYWYWAK